MTPECRVWTERMIARWSARVEQLLEHPDTTTAEMTRADMLDLRVADLRRRLDSAPMISADGARIAELEASLAICQPYLHPVYRVMFNQGLIMQEVRNGILAKLGRPLEEIELTPSQRWRSAPETPPDRDPEPFVFTEQVDMFA